MTRGARKALRIASFACMALAVLLSAVPLAPAVTYYGHVAVSSATGNRFEPGRATDTPTPEGQRLRIPKIFVDTPILEGSSDETLRKGIWHRPNTGEPGSGNMVLTGHRFMYTFGPKTFYNLDKLTVGDKVEVDWNGTRYAYSVIKTEVVGPEASYIEDPTEKHRLTLYTCTPLWTSKNRLVVTAEISS